MDVGVLSYSWCVCSDQFQGTYESSQSTLNDLQKSILLFSDQSHSQYGQFYLG